VSSLDGKLPKRAKGCTIPVPADKRSLWASADLWATTLGASIQGRSYLVVILSVPTDLDTHHQKQRQLQCARSFLAQAPYFVILCTTGLYHAQMARQARHRAYQRISQLRHGRGTRVDNTGPLHCWPGRSEQVGGTSSWQLHEVAVNGE
jgi:hypothetical protein